MSVRVYYHTTTGNTKKVADVIAETAGCRAVPIESGMPADRTDILFLGGAVYATHDHDIPPSLKLFIASLDPKKTGLVHVFCTGFTPKANETMKRLLQARGMKVSPESFFCKGKLFMVFNPGRPNAQDLTDAEVFTRKVLGSGERAAGAGAGK